MSLEHLWPVWLLASVGATGSSQIEGWVETQTAPRIFKGALQSKCVCTPCNSGWMSDLEVSTRTLLESLIHDQPSSLSDNQQAILARWSVKTAMVFESTSRSKEFYYSQDERSSLFSKRLIPSDTYISVGRYLGDVPLQAKKVRLSTSTRPDILSGGIVTTFILGRLVLQVASFRRASEIYVPIIIDENGCWVQFLSLVWPVRSAMVKWPPMSSFPPVEDVLDTISQRFTRSISPP